jgi:hypothetical protein
MEKLWKKRRRRNGGRKKKRILQMPLEDGGKPVFAAVTSKKEPYC